MPHFAVRPSAAGPIEQPLVYYYKPHCSTQGKLERAAALYRDYLAVAPRDHSIRSAYLFLMHFLPGSPPREASSRPIRSGTCCTAVCDSQSRTQLSERAAIRAVGCTWDISLRISKITAWAVSWHRSLLPTASVEVFAYADSVESDDLTERLHKSADHWRLVYGQDFFPQLTQTIRADEIDILVDLTMHMPANRMLLFATGWHRCKLLTSLLQTPPALPRWTIASAIQSLILWERTLTTQGAPSVYREAGGCMNHRPRRPCRRRVPKTPRLSLVA